MKKWIAAWAALPVLAIGTWAWADDKPVKKDDKPARKKEDKAGKKKEAAGAAGKGNVLVIHAKPTAKLSARLRAVQLTNGKVVGRVAGNGIAVEVPQGKMAATEKKLKDAGAKVKREAPEKPAPVDELVLSYKQAPSDAQMTKMGLKIAKTHKTPDGVVLLVKPTKPLSKELVDQLEKEAHLTHAETNKTVSLPKPDLGKLLKPAKVVKHVPFPNDPEYAKLWGMQNIRAPLAWAKGTKSPIVVAVIDTGVDLKHEDLKAHLVKGFNAITPSAQPQDDHGHGTHCAGTIGGIGNNKKGVVGVCWSVKIMPCKFLGKTGSGSLFDAIQCIDFATAHGAKVMSNSWSGGGFSQALFDAIGRANKKGILFVAAAGNSATDNDATPTYPASYKQPNIVAVAAIDIADAKASFSCFGKTSVHLSAPGVQVFSSVPKAGALGNASGYTFLSGTSMATPHVSGAAALALGHSKYHAYKADKLKKLLLDHVRKIPAMSGKCTTGGTLDITFLGK